MKTTECIVINNRPYHTGQSGQVYAEDPQQVFEWAIQAGALLTDSGRIMYAGDYMYMHSELIRGQLRHSFKHTDKRNYVELVEEVAK